MTTVEFHIIPAYLLIIMLCFFSITTITFSILIGYKPINKFSIFGLIGLLFGIIAYCYLLFTYNTNKPLANEFFKLEKEYIQINYECQTGTSKYQNDSICSYLLKERDLKMLNIIDKIGLDEIIKYEK